MRYFLKPFLLSLSAVVCLAPLPANSQSRAAEDSPKLQTQALRIGNAKLQVEVADTNQTRQRGLMHRRFMAEDHGMLFVFERAERRCFWMRNTYIPLSIAYLDEYARIIDILDMKPLDESSVCSTAPAQYALEVNQGWFERHQIKIGDRVQRIVH